MMLFILKNEDIFCWAATGPRVEPIGRAMSQLAKRRKGLFPVTFVKMVPLDSREMENTRRLSEGRFQGLSWLKEVMTVGIYAPYCIIGRIQLV